MIKICEHLHDNGSTCGSPALTGYNFCYFHQRLRHPRHRPGDFEYKLPVLDTPHAILMATQHITQAALDGVLEPSRARLVLSALRLATTALKEMKQDDKGTVVGRKQNDVGEGRTNMEEARTDVGTGALARATRAQLAVSAEPSDKAAPSATASPTLSSRAPLSGEGSASCPEQRNNVAGSEKVGALAPMAKKPPLSTTQLKLMKKILRRGPSHPRFATAARLLDHRIAEAHS